MITTDYYRRDLCGLLRFAIADVKATLAAIHVTKTSLINLVESSSSTQVALLLQRGRAMLCVRQ